MTTDDWLIENEHNSRGWNSAGFECPECGTEVDKEYQHCSTSCWKASQI